MSLIPKIIPAVGKSGAGIISISSSKVISGLSNNAEQASTTSLRLCGGIFVAIPTAIPVVPLINKLGIRVGITNGSCSEPS